MVEVSRMNSSNAMKRDTKGQEETSGANTWVTLLKDSVELQICASAQPKIVE